MNKKLIGKCIVATIAGVLIAGCGGGGSGSGSGSPANFTPTATMNGGGGGGGGGGTAGTSAAGTPVASYIADAQGTSFVGYWLNLITSAQVYTTNLSAGLSAGTYNIALGIQVLSGTTWSTGTVTTPATNLTPTGWVKASVTGNTFVDNGDGIHATENKSNGATIQYAIGAKSLAGAAITCKDFTGATITCTAPGSYPAGSTQYTLTYASTLYTIYGAPAYSPVPMDQAWR